MSEWISVDLMLPDDEIVALVYATDGTMLLCRLGPERLFNRKFITHWQPLPSPPKAD